MDEALLARLYAALLRLVDLLRRRYDTSLEQVRIAFHANQMGVDRPNKIR